jgi:glycosyltransferase involved in cell wall biosynthesis
LKLVPRAPEEVVIGFIGRIVEAKGLGTLARALGEIRDLTWRLVVIGSGEFEETVRRMLDESQVGNRVQFLGYVPHEQTARYLSAFDLLVLPSETQSNWEEQFGRVIPEALACGTCVLGSDSGEIPQLIGQSGGGVIFPQRDVAALAEALRGLLSNESRRRELARIGQEWVRNHLSLHATASRMAETILECHEGKR